MDEMIDGLNRAVNATVACSDWCRRFAEQGAKTFEDEKMHFKQRVQPLSVSDARKVRCWL